MSVSVSILPCVEFADCSVTFKVLIDVFESAIGNTINRKGQVGSCFLSRFCQVDGI